LPLSFGGCKESEPYNWNGRTVISYRGTDNYTTGLTVQGGSDLFFGWVAGTGTPTDQTSFAIQFYEELTGVDVFSDLQFGSGISPESVTFTGHSLGGGLAEVLSLLTGQRGVGFDWMPGALVAEYYAGHLGGTINYTNFRGISVENEVLSYVRSGDIQGFLANLPEPVLIGLALYFGINIDFSDPQQSLSEIARLTNLLEQLYVRETPLPSFLSSINPFDTATKLHTIDMLVALQFVRDNSFTDWTSVGWQMWRAYFDDKIATANGIGGVGEGGQATAESKMGRMIAYSALDGTEGLVFGNTGIRALFDDANQLGKLKTDGRMESLVDELVIRIANAFVQHAGLLAFNKVVSQEDSVAREGMVSFVDDGIKSEIIDEANGLLLDFSEARWMLGAAADAPNPRILGAGEIVDFITRGIVNITEVANPIIKAFEALYGEAASYVIERIEFTFADTDLIRIMAEAEDDTLAVGDAQGPRHVWGFVSGGGDDVVFGNSTANFLGGGEGNDILKGGAGKDILAGGKGDDDLHGNGVPTIDAGGNSVNEDNEADFFFGGIGNDFYYVSDKDVISDNKIQRTGDGLGNVKFDEILLTGSKAANPPTSGNSVTGDDGAVYTVSDDGKNLIATLGGKSITIQSWKNGELGIKFDVTHWYWTLTATDWN
jgi:hypothetical protein